MSSRDGQINPSTLARKRKSRGKGLRVRTGCNRCKTRHVKCGEERPVCSACEKSGHHCEYLVDQPSGSPQHDGGLAASDPVPASRAGIPDTESDLGLDFAPGQQMRGRLESGNGALHDYNNAQAQLEAHVDFADEPLYNAAAFETSPESAWSGWGSVSAETAPLKWFGLVATDAGHEESHALQAPLQSLSTPRHPGEMPDADPPDVDDMVGQDPPGSLVAQLVEYYSQDEISLSAHEMALLRHFVLDMSSWIDVTDRDRSFAVIVPQMALRNQGVMNAVLALSARHLSIVMPLHDNDASQSAKTTALQYYYQTLSYLQQEMRSIAFLTSNELLATVLLISTYEMIDGSGRGWERHLKGVFWIQRSQLIHGESEGLKQRIWWAWLRQDIWVAYREQRKILSYYSLTQECSDLGFWELVDRAVWLLGQCVNYASLKEQRSGQSDIRGRVDKSSSLWARLDTWTTCFAKYDRRLPTAIDSNVAFKPIWINPPAAGKSDAPAQQAITYTIKP